jgi:hypothetical protein
MTKGLLKPIIECKINSMIFYKNLCDIDNDFIGKLVSNVRA